MSITLYHAHIVTSATTPPATNCSKFKMFDSLVDVSGCGWQWISGLFQFICQLTVNCELIIITGLGLVSSDVQLSSSLAECCSQLHSSHPLGTHLGSICAHYSGEPLTLLLAWCCIMFIIISLIVLGIYVIFMIIVHWLSQAHFFCLRVTRPRVLGSLVRNKTNSDPIIRFYWVPPSLELTACSW